MPTERCVPLAPGSWKLRLANSMRQSPLPSQNRAHLQAWNNNRSCSSSWSSSDGFQNLRPGCHSRRRGKDLLALPSYPARAAGPNRRQPRRALLQLPYHQSYQRNRTGLSWFCGIRCIACFPRRKCGQPLSHPVRPERSQPLNVQRKDVSFGLMGGRHPRKAVEPTAGSLGKDHNRTWRSAWLALCFRCLFSRCWAY